ncbi:Putative polysaccharide deacetylase [Fulvia fulva]|uniref:Polysaccharide deacetylase n=1 Tax=Passalora fulva TaxID=5499 RepID=A0A9Q8PHI5_PASFU|nr:Putative polysaccharide deacetylase [Fulvia fulva]KAK4615940.1 putative polysaccharide deacetylase [Fulvia fulva]KAK4616966.1 putative polysaccharide deacetylase [Fulvia fulva]UJO22502.1 Putative polysaccharide deacetylase [Fulvia fulva]WPV19678.1 Putative polysaccharide deacetylase [Fulvia fulva]WPV34650.1 Putative polysaccharide deacetylase [Fulvia fulva]
MSARQPPRSSPQKWTWDNDYDVRRDLLGYGPNPPNPNWPNNAKLALSFVLNYEGGGEYSVLNGDSHSESFLSESIGSPPVQQGRNLNIESMYEYGSRAGVWRVLNVFADAGVRGTVYGVGKALDDNPRVVTRCLQMGWEVAAHGDRWIDYHDMSVEKECQDVVNCASVIRQQTGEPPKGWYIGRLSPRTHRIIYHVYKEKGWEQPWLSDSYADDLPYWKPLPNGCEGNGREWQLVLPYSLDCNDFKYLMPNNWSSSEDFFQYLKDSFDELYREGEKGKAKMMSVGLHARISGKPGRIGTVSRFVEYVQSKRDVWIATRTEIAEHGRQTDPYPAE